MRFEPLASTWRPTLGCSVGLALALSACAGADGTNGDWYYHWDCHGDAECLSTNPNGTATGTNDEGPSEAACTELLTFSEHNWGTAAKDSCDQNPDGSADGSPDAGTQPTPDEVAPLTNPANTYWTCNGSSMFFLTLASNGTGVYQRDTIPSSLIAAFTWQEGADKASIQVTTVGFSWAGLVGIAPNFTPNPTHFTYDHGVYDCALTSGNLPGIPTDLSGGFILQGGLTWMPNNADGTQGWSAANTYCATATINGNTGWRLPTLVELQTLFSSGAITSAEMSAGWAYVSTGGGTLPTWTSDSGGTGSHKAVSELSLSGTTAADSTLYQVTCVQ